MNGVVGGYFRENILLETVIPSLRDPDNVLEVGQAVFVHDKTPHMRAKATQNLLKVENVDFWGKRRLTRKFIRSQPSRAHGRYYQG